MPIDAESNKSAWIYSHAIATIALCEAVGMTGDQELRVPAQKAIDFIVATQHSSQGGWRYSADPSSSLYGSDTSVTGWQMMALKSAELAGLNVPKESLERIERYLDQAQVSRDDPSQYVYTPFQPNRQSASDLARPTMTSVGLLMRLYSGWNRDNPHVRRGADVIAQSLPRIGGRSNQLRDTYYWYYATQVMFHMGGDHWRRWNGALHPLLVDTQIKRGRLAGSWDPQGPVPDRWGPQGGRIYVTTMNLLSLEVNYRHLPIYESTAR
jgi:hypothetical protein